MLMNHGMRAETVNRTGSDDYCYMAGTELQNRRSIGWSRGRLATCLTVVRRRVRVKLLYELLLAGCLPYVWQLLCLCINGYFRTYRKYSVADQIGAVTLLSTAPHKQIYILSSANTVKLMAAMRRFRLTMQQFHSLRFWMRIDLICEFIQILFRNTFLFYSVRWGRP